MKLEIRFVAFILCLSLVAIPFTTRVSGQKSLAVSDGPLVADEPLVATPIPIQIDGNPDCATLNASTDPAFAHISQDWGLKVERSGDMPYSDFFYFVNGQYTELQGGAGASPGSWVQLDVGGNTVNWQSNRLITAVIVKGGPQANVYPYNPASFGGFPNSDGTGLTTGDINNVSHVTFCFEAIAPSAAPALVSGRAVDAYGQGIWGVQIAITDVQTGNTRMALSNPFGYYTIEGLEVANFYVMWASHKRFSFVEDTKAFTLNEDLAGVDFVANP